MLFLCFASLSHSTCFSLFSLLPFVLSLIVLCCAFFSLVYVCCCDLLWSVLMVDGSSLFMLWFHFDQVIVEMRNCFSDVHFIWFLGRFFFYFREYNSSRFFCGLVTLSNRRWSSPDGHLRSIRVAKFTICVAVNRVSLLLFVEH